MNYLQIYVFCKNELRFLIYSETKGAFNTKLKSLSI